jgi:hypothetical protein
MERLHGLFKRLRTDQRGQLTIDNFFNIFVLVMIVCVMLPVLIMFIQGVLGNVDPTTALLLGLIPVALVVGIIKTINAYSQPYQAFLRGQ